MFVCVRMSRGSSGRPTQRFPGSLHAHVNAGLVLLHACITDNRMLRARTSLAFETENPPGGSWFPINCYHRFSRLMAMSNILSW